MIIAHIRHSSIIVLILMSLANVSSADGTQDSSTDARILQDTCDIDALDDLRPTSGYSLTREQLSLVPLAFQKEAQKILGEKEVTELTPDQGERYSGRRKFENRTPYLVRTCLYGVNHVMKTENFDLQRPKAQEFFERIIASKSIEPIYAPQRERLSIISVRAGHGDLGYNPVAFVIWHNLPITNIRNLITYIN